jgi:hypothetical protein
MPTANRWRGSQPATLFWPRSSESWPSWHTTAGDGFPSGITDPVYRSRPFVPGERIELPDLTVEVRRVNQQGRVTEAWFRFDVRLEDPSLRWVRWEDGALVPFQPRPCRCERGQILLDTIPGRQKSPAEDLSPPVTLEDIRHHIYVQQLVDEGLKDIEEGRNGNVALLLRRGFFRHLDLGHLRQNSRHGP